MITWRADFHDELASTSDHCIAQAKAGAAEGLTVFAASQTAGRGSRGRHWQAPAGNLHASFLLRPRLPAAESGVFALLAGLATATAMPESMAITLKWPNDLLHGPAKLGGILIDAAPAGPDLDWLVIGIGLNLQTAPTIAGRATTSLAAHGIALAPRDAFAAVAASLRHWLHILDTEGAAPIHAAWLAHAHPIGAPLTVQTATTATTGVFAGLATTGELLLRTENRIERFNTGEIMLGQGAS